MPMTEAKFLQALGLLYLVIGKAFQRNSVYQFQYSVGYSIFLLSSGWEAARKILAESQKRNSSLFSSFTRLFANLLPVYDLILLIFSLLCLQFYTNESLACAHKNAFLASMGFLNLDIFYREALQPKIYNGKPPPSSCDHPFDGYSLCCLLIQSIFILHFIYYISRKISDSKKNRKTIRFVILASLTIAFFWANLWNSTIGRFWCFWAGALLGSVLPFPCSGREESKSQSSIETCTTTASTRVLTIAIKKNPLVNPEPGTQNLFLKICQAASLTTILCFFLPFTTLDFVSEMFVSIATIVILISSIFQRNKPKFWESAAKDAGPLMWSVFVVIHPIQFLIRKAEVLPQEEEAGAVLPLAFCAGLVLHFAFARPLARMENKQVYYAISLLFILTVSICIFSSLIVEFLSGDREAAILENSQYINRQYSLEDCMPLGKERLPKPYGYCEYPEGAGDIRVLLVGGLFAATDAPYIFKQFGLRYDRFRVFTQTGFHPLKPAQQPNVHHRLMKIIQRFKPTALIINQDFGGERAGPAKNHQDDIMIAYRRSINVFLNANITRIIVAGPRPLPAKGALKKLEKYLKKSEAVPIDEFTYNLVKIRGHVHRRLKNMHEKVTAVFLDEIFSKKNNLTLYDPLSYVAYLDDNMALTDLGAQVAVKYFERIVDTALGIGEIDVDDEYLDEELEMGRENGANSTKIPVKRKQKGERPTTRPPKHPNRLKTNFFKKGKIFVEMPLPENSTVTNSTIS
ncbi:unnamed protein product, partial [Mesorhabditis belari]|uniref:SGNH domain-containing protein n=1 Tax=Mesorhabditis belari TaxID=2138241 RepID=A0AAF3EP35_9BILA